jgi:non-heme chloroperoxidase
MPCAQTKDGTQLYYKTWGEGCSVYLMHGWPVTADTWDDLGIEIANHGMRAIAYDRRGFGRSDQPWAGYSYERLADDLLAIMTTTKASRDSAIIGFLMGGGEVARYMSRHAGKNIAQAVLIASVVPYMLKTDDNPDGVPQSTFDEMAAGMTKDRAKFWSSFMKDFYGVGVISSPVSDEIIEWSRMQAMMAGLNPTLKCAEAFATTDFRPDLKSFKVPTLVIHGTSDKTVPIDTAGRAAAKGIADAELIEYEGGPHGLLATHKDEIARDVVDFLTTHKAIRSRS